MAQVPQDFPTVPCVAIGSAICTDWIFSNNLTMLIVRVFLISLFAARGSCKEAPSVCDANAGCEENEEGISLLQVQATSIAHGVKSPDDAKPQVLDGAIAETSEHEMEAKDEANAQGQKNSDHMKRLVAGAKALKIEEEDSQDIDKKQPLAALAANSTFTSPWIAEPPRYGPIPVVTGDGTTTNEAYCTNSEKRFRMYHSTQVNAGYTLQACSILACTFGQCADSYFYSASAQGDDMDFTGCVCCGPGSLHGGMSNSAIYPSKAGNKIYYCAQPQGGQPAGITNGQ